MTQPMLARSEAMLAMFAPNQSFSFDLAAITKSSPCTSKLRIADLSGTTDTLSLVNHKTHHIYIFGDPLTAQEEAALSALPEGAVLEPTNETTAANSTWTGPECWFIIPKDVDVSSKPAFIPDKHLMILGSDYVGSLPSNFEEFKLSSKIALENAGAAAGLPCVFAPQAYWSGGSCLPPGIFWHLSTTYDRLLANIQEA